MAYPCNRPYFNRFILPENERENIQIVRILSLNKPFVIFIHLEIPPHCD